MNKTDDKCEACGKSTDELLEKWQNNPFRADLNKVETNSKAQKLASALAFCFLISWIGSCSVGLYTEKKNLIALGAFYFFVTIFFAHITKKMSEEAD